MKKYTLLVVAVVFCASFIAKQKYNSTNLKRRVILDVPVDFHRLSDEEIIVKYGMDRVPLGIFEDELGDVSISITENIDSLRTAKINYKSEEEKKNLARDLSIEKSFLVSSYRSYFESMNMLIDTVYEQNGIPMAFLAYESKFSGVNEKNETVVTEQYNYMVYGYRRNRSYLINFSCPLYLKQDWEKTAKEIISSVQF